MVRNSDAFFDEFINKFISIHHNKFLFKFKKEKN